MYRRLDGVTGWFVCLGGGVGALMAVRNPSSTTVTPLRSGLTVDRRIPIDFTHLQEPPR